QLIPLVAVAGILFSRYTFLGFFPLLIPPAWLLADLLPRLRFQLPRLAYAPAAALAIAAILAWPTFVSAWSAVNWRAPTLTVSDDTQFLTKFPSGTSTEQAIDWLDHAAKRQPITIIVGHWVGLPNDMLYLTFDHNPNIQLLHWLDNQYPLHPLAGRPNTYNLSDDRWLDTHIRPITLDPTRPTYLLCPALRDDDTNQMRQYLPFDKLPPGTHLVTLFENTPIAKTHSVAAELRLLQIPVTPPPPPAAIAQR
ncbi:MAG TPA: hypothetical protein VM008_00360, partial [Phycisphaerae bacterium]|nr:hypothetical protein [Phycisphaerae bacterium]